MSSYLVGVAGGSGSGKTYFAKEVRRRLGEGVCEIIYQDNYYYDQSARFDRDGGAVNFDHPQSLDFDLLTRHLAQLKASESVEIPTYDFKTHKRLASTIRLRPRPVILVDGILIFHPEPLRALFDDRIFFDTPESLRFERRLQRDVRERGRSPEGVRAQFTNQVKPMHDAFVEPCKAFAQTRVEDVGEFESVVDAYVEKLARLCL